MPINRKKHKRLGLCYRCTKPAKRGYVRCEYHLEINKKESQIQKQKRRDEGRCLACGRQLTEDDFVLRRAKITCLNCAEETFRWR